MAEFSLPKNSKVTKGKHFPAPGAKNVRTFKVYRWNPDDSANPRTDTYEVVALTSEPGFTWTGDTVSWVATWADGVTDDGPAPEACTTPATTTTTTTTSSPAETTVPPPSTEPGTTVPAASSTTLSGAPPSGPPSSVASSRRLPATGPV